MIRLSFILMVFLLGFSTVVFSQPQPNLQPQVSQSRESLWKADLELLKQELPKRHPNLFFKKNKIVFEQELESLVKSTDRLSNQQMAFELRKIIASLGDSHTAVVPDQSEMFYPLLLMDFSEGTYVVGAPDFLSEWIGAKLIAVGGVSVAQVIEKIRPLVVAENESWFKAQWPQELTRPSTLLALGLTQSLIQSHWTLQTRLGQIKTLSLSLPLQKSSVWKAVWEPQSPLWTQQPKQFYWMQSLPTAHAVYFNYRRCQEQVGQPFSVFTQNLLQALQAPSVQRWVIDLRQNNGGDSRLLEPLIQAFEQNPTLKKQVKVFVLIGRYTFSSAFLNALSLKQRLGATLIGEPTGQKPNHFGEIKSFQLPNSRLVIQYSTRFFKTMEQDPVSLEPDIRVDWRAEDFLNGRDTVLDRVFVLR